MGFIMDGLEAEAYDRNYSDAVLLNRIGSYFRPHARKMITVGVLVAIGSLLGTAVPIIIAQGLERIVATPDNTTLVASLAVLVGIIGAAGWLFNYVRATLSSRAVGDVVLALRRDAFTAVTQRDMSFYDQFSSGKIVSRVTSDTQDFSTVVTLTVDLLSQLLLVITITIVMFVVNPRLALYNLAMAPLVIIAALGFRTLARRTTQRAQRAIARVNATIQETVSGIAVAKSFRRERSIYETFSESNRIAYGARLQQGLVFASIFPLLNIISGIAIVIVIYFGGREVLAGSITVGDWYLFVQSLAIFFFPLTSVASFWSQFQQGLSASERVFALIDAEPRVVQTGKEPVDRIAGRITFEDVYFTYDREATAESSIDREWVLPGFSLDIPAGQKLAVVGHTGAGKSSLMKLITRFYEFQRGRILVDGRDTRSLDLAEYRRLLGLVPQTPFLFSGTVADNIRYGRRDASDAEVEAAARQLGDEWLGDLPQGLATDVGERGARLSLGQRQLTALARVLLQDPAIFLLDEATASIDPFTEAQIQDGLDVVMGRRTSIIIAHRLSTVRTADRIIVLKGGLIIEEGSHDQLLSQGGHYAELYNTYFRHQSLDYKPWEATPAGR